MSTKKIVFALSLASTLALVAGLLVASEVRASALESGTELPVDPSVITEAAEAALDPSALAQVQAFDGEWSYVGGQKEREGIDAAITASVNALNPMLRGIASRRLAESCGVPGRVSIAVSGENATIKFDGDGHQAKLDGTPVKATSAQGDKIKVSHKLEGQRLLQFIDGSGGDRHTYFKLNEDGTRLTVKIKISSDRLPVPVEYRLSFKRK